MFGRYLILAVVASALGLPAQDASTGSFHVLCYVQTEREGAGFPVLVSNKDWDGGTVKDYTTHHAYGSSRTSGTLGGWAIALQPSGAWMFNIGDGRDRLDYRPTAPRQRVNDGRLHMIGFCLDRERGECRLYFDGRNVAIYSANGIESVVGDGRMRKAKDVVEQHYEEEVTIDAAIARTWSERKGAASTAAETGEVRGTSPSTLRVLAWNIWHGGRRDGAQVGIRKTVEAIRKSKADIVCMQETYGSGPAIADALGYYLFLRSTNLSVMSRYPIGRSFDLYQPFRFGGVELEIEPGRAIKVFSLWIHHLPSVGKQMAQEKISAEELIAAEEKTRGREIRGILDALQPHLQDTDATRVIVAGDFNSPSHVDWTEATAGGHRGLRVAWPVSSAMVAAGFKDAYRMIHTDPEAKVGRTWSPRFKETYQQRIDYVYYKGSSLHPTAAEVLDSHPDGWPSDHAAVLATFELRPL